MSFHSRSAHNDQLDYIDSWKQPLTSERTFLEWCYAFKRDFEMVGV